MVTQEPLGADEPAASGPGEPAAIPRRAAHLPVIAPGTALQVGGATALTHSLHILSLALDHLRARLGAQLALNAVDVSALVETYNNPGLRPTDLGRALNMGSAGLTALSDRLVRAGYLRRTPDPSDRRGSRLHLTPAGQHAVGWVFDTVTEALAHHDGDRDDDDLAVTLVQIATAIGRI